jgi:hypothetical protein
MDYLKFSIFMKEDFEISNKKYNTIKFFRSELVLVFIWFWVLENHYKSKKNQLFKSNVEMLVSQIPKQLGSRPTIFKFIEQAIASKHIIRVVDPSDKRKWNLKPSTQTIQEFEQWADGFSGF